MSNDNPVVHFEMPYEDRQRMTAFYQTAFGWKMNSMDSDMGDYVVAETTATKDGRPSTPGAINGGFFPRSAQSAQVPSIVISVADIKAAMQKVRDAGGEILGEPVDIPGVGTYVSFLDSEKNRASLLQPAM